MACSRAFFFGDCAPHLKRPAQIRWRVLFRYLMNREELEYYLESDVERYCANLARRWNTPEYAALFLDAVRKLQVLQSTKSCWENTRVFH